MSISHIPICVVFCAVSNHGYSQEMSTNLLVANRWRSKFDGRFTVRRCGTCESKLIVGFDWECIWLNVFDLQEPNIKLKEKFLSLEAYGFGSTDNGPHEYYFEINLFESINIEVNIFWIKNSFFNGWQLIYSCYE